MGGESLLPAVSAGSIITTGVNVGEVLRKQVPGLICEFR